jgi:hypothetical protein
MVEHHEAGVDVDLFSVLLNRDRIGVAARIIVLFKNGEVILLLKKMRAAHARYTGSYDCQLFHLFRMLFQEPFNGISAYLP